MTKLNQLIITIKETVKPLIKKHAAAKKELILSYPAAKSNSFKIEFNNTAYVMGGIKISKSYCDRVSRATHMKKLGYTKSLIQGYCGRTEKDIDAKLEKDIEQSLGKIEIAVTKKIKLDNIKKVLLLNLNRATGFIEGSWMLTDINGKEGRLSIESILAGGYNIQCLHLRTLYKFN